MVATNSCASCSRPWGGGNASILFSHGSSRSEVSVRVLYASSCLESPAAADLRPSFSPALAAFAALLTQIALTRFDHVAALIVSSAEPSGVEVAVSDAVAAGVDPA